MFRKSMLERRCAIPTTGFYEWGPTPEGKKQKYEFQIPGQTELYLGGIWNEFAGERRCVIMTTAANASMDGIHDRMPVILQKGEVETWVKDTEAAVDILHRVPPQLGHSEVQG